LRERERIADELHDRVAQILYAAQLGIDTILETASEEAEIQRMIEIRELLIKGDTSIRDVIHRLTAAAPQSNVTRRLRLEIESVEDEFGVAVHVELPDDDTLKDVPRPVTEAIVKIAREGTVNAAKHAGPCRISLDLRVDDTELVLSILDDGLGVSSVPRHTGHGLTSLHRLAEDAGGTITLTAPAAGFGSLLRATFPL
jgi:signal transduction histidine kinase